MSLDRGACTRRDFFRAMLDEMASTAGAVVTGWSEGFSSVGPGAPAVRPPAKPFVRPPGAAPEDRFLELCTRCDDCVKACPHWVIRKAGPEFGARLEGSPVILPAENPCLFCEGLPCAAACTTGALTLPPPGQRLRIGLAAVDAALCYMGQGQPCDYCVKDCPVVPKAVRVAERGRAAVIDAALCTGCGECAQVCPANAITIEAIR